MDLLPTDFLCYVCFPFVMEKFSFTPSETKEAVKQKCPLQVSEAGIL